MVCVVDSTDVLMFLKTDVMVCAVDSAVVVMFLDTDRGLWRTECLRHLAGHRVMMMRYTCRGVSNASGTGSRISWSS